MVGQLTECTPQQLTQRGRVHPPASHHNRRCAIQKQPSETCASHKWRAHEYTHDSTALSSDSSPIRQLSSLFASALKVLLMYNHQQHSNMLLTLHLCWDGV